MVDCYLEKGTMYVIEDNDVKAECVVTDEGNGILEIKNIAVDPKYHRMGYGKVMIDFLANKYEKEYSILQVGTGDSPLTISFYEKCGFVRSHKIPNFFTDNYDHPIYEGGVQLIDMYICKGIYNLQFIGGEHVLARAKYQVLVIPYHIENGNVKYCIFKRNDIKVWQFIAGGGEDEVKL